MRWGENAMIHHSRCRKRVARCRKRLACLLKTMSVLPALMLTIAAPLRAQSTADMKMLLDDLVAANRILYRQGVVDGFGHVSVRHPARPDRFLMSAAKAPGRVTAEDIMEFDLEGKPIDGRERSIYS